MYTCSGMRSHNTVEGTRVVTQPHLASAGFLLWLHRLLATRAEDAISSTFMFELKLQTRGPWGGYEKKGKMPHTNETSKRPRFSVCYVWYGVCRLESTVWEKKERGLTGRRRPRKHRYITRANTAEKNAVQESTLYKHAQHVKRQAGPIQAWRQHAPGDLRAWNDTPRGGRSAAPMVINAPVLHNLTFS
jgi:hypothetical protein